MAADRVAELDLLRYGVGRMWDASLDSDGFLRWGIGVAPDAVSYPARPVRNAMVRGGTLGSPAAAQAAATAGQLAIGLLFAWRVGPLAMARQ